MKIKIKVTKEVLRKSMYCGTAQGDGETASNCAIAIAIRDIMPNASVFPCSGIRPFGSYSEDGIELPHEARQLIFEFDELSGTPEKRLDIQPMQFEIDIPDTIIDRINISDIHKSATLELA